jgi:Flp pilus assembly protein TadD
MKALTERHPDDDAWHELGSLLAFGGRHDEAIRAFDEAIKKNPGGAKSHAGRGASHRDLGEKKMTEAAWAAADAELTRAVADLTRATELGAHDTTVLGALAATKMRLGVTRQQQRIDEGDLYDQAVADATRAIDLRPADPDLRCIRGEALKLLDRTDEARADAQAALKAAPGHKGATDLLKRLSEE